MTSLLLMEHARQPGSVGTVNAV